MAAQAQRRIAIFGGSFNPPHVAHQLTALYVLETEPVDELWIVPVYRHAFGKDLVPFSHRLAMCELIAAPLKPRVKVSRVEEELAKKPGFVASRTLDLVEHLARYGQLRLVVGADVLTETDKWHRWDDLVKKAPPIVIARPGYPGGGALAMPDVSATDIRARLERKTPADREALRSLLPASVLRYIATNGLYS